MKRNQDRTREVLPRREEEVDILLTGSMAVDDESDVEEIMSDQDGSGETFDPKEAAEGGLSYTPPQDPPVVPSEDPEGIEVAAGFAPSMEETDPDAQIVPNRINEADLEIEEDVQLALEYNSETAHLTDVSVVVHRGVVHLHGTVPGEDDVALVYEVVSDLAGVVRVVNHLEVEE